MKTTIFSSRNIFWVSFETQYYTLKYFKLYPYFCLPFICSDVSWHSVFPQPLWDVLQSIVWVWVMTATRLMDLCSALQLTSKVHRTEPFLRCWLFTQLVKSFPCLMEIDNVFIIVCHLTSWMKSKHILFIENLHTHTRKLTTHMRIKIK